MAERRLSIYSGPPIEAALACIGEHYAENKSGRLNTVCERYLVMVTDALARMDFSKGEWCAILDANNGVAAWIGDAEISATMLWANVHDSGPELGEKWQIDLAALVAKLQATPKSSLVAIQEVCDRFWSHSKLPTDKAMAAAGIIPMEDA